MMTSPGSDGKISACAHVALLLDPDNLIGLRRHFIEDRTMIIMGSLRILHIIAQLPSRTGSGVYYSILLIELKNFGHEQAALFTVQDDFMYDSLDSRLQYPVVFKSGRLPFPIAGMSDVMPYENTVYSRMDEGMLKAWREAFEDMLYRAKKEFQPDVVILHHLWILTSVAAEMFDTQVKVGICHNTDIRQAEQHPDMIKVHIANLRKLDAVFSLSDSQKELITDIYGIERSRIITMGGGFNHKLFFPSASKTKGKKTEIVFSAKVERSKGVFELVKAFKNVSSSRSDLHLHIIGTPNDENADMLRALIGDAENIGIVPITSQKTLAEFIRERDIFVMPSYFEGLGLMAIECLASGLRVVSTEIEALISLLGDRVNSSRVIEYVKLPRIYDTDKPFEDDIGQFVDDLSAKLLLQIDRVKKGEPFPAQVFAEINRLSWDGIADNINNVIERLAGR